MRTFILAAFGAAVLSRSAHAFKKSYALADIDDAHLQFAYKDGAEEIFKSHFTNNDHNRDGFVTKEEGFENLIHAGHWDLDELMGEVDHNKDGAVDFEEYIKHIVEEHERAGMHTEL